MLQGGYYGSKREIWANLGGSGVCDDDDGWLLRSGQSSPQLSPAIFLQQIHSPSTQSRRSGRGNRFDDAQGDVLFQVLQHRLFPMEWNGNGTVERVRFGIFHEFQSHQITSHVWQRLTRTGVDRTVFEECQNSRLKLQDVLLSGRERNLRRKIWWW